jgi:flavodoxin
MKALVAFHSLFGNTKQLAEVIAAQLGEEASVSVKPLRIVTPTDVQGLDLFVLGTPTHKLGIPAEASAALGRLPSRSLKGVKVAAFDTSLHVFWFVDLFHASGQLLSRLRRLGGKPVAAAEVFWVEGMQGPLADGELERAKAWARQLALHKQ